MKTKLNAIGLFVTDINKMVSFYRDVMGFKIEWEGAPYAEFKNDGVRFMMYGRTDFEKLIKKDLSYPKGLNGTFELAIKMPLYSDVDKEYERVIKLGATPVYPPKDEPWNMRSSYVADPEGNLIEIGSFNRDPV